MRGRDLAEKLKSGQKVYGTCVISPSPHWPRAIKSLGLDFVFIDTEHICIDRHQLSWMCQAYAALGLPPIVRIPTCDPTQACCVLDGGASGIIAPYIESAEQVKQLRGAIKLRPLKGEKLQRVLAGEKLDDTTAKYLEENNKDKLMFINIESIAGIAAMDEILQVPGVDAIQVGPHDLSIQLGIPEQYHHPEFDKAIKQIISKARAYNVGVGLHFWGVEQEINWVNFGANLIVHASDLVAVREKLKADIDTIKKGVGSNLHSEHTPNLFV